MSLVSLLACRLTIMFYDWLQREWLGIEAIKSLKEYDGPNRIGGALGWLIGNERPFVYATGKQVLQPRPLALLAYRA